MSETTQTARHEARYADGPTDPADVAAYEHDEAAAAVAHTDGATGAHTCATCEAVIAHATTHAGFTEPGCALCVAEADQRRREGR